MSKDDVPTLNVVSLFAGIGGFELAFRKVGARTNLMCEIDPIAKSVLAVKMPGVDIVDDVRTIDQLPAGTDVLCAGFPCQDLSSVGCKKGLAGTRSSLVKEVFRIVERSLVEWIIFENVSFMLQLKKGETMQFITDQLERLGYRWAYRTIDSVSFVPQHRCRVFVVASLHHDPRNVILSGESKKSAETINYDSLVKPIGFYWTEGKFGLGLQSDAVPTLKAGSTIGIASPPAILFPNGELSMPDIRDAERLQGFPANWTRPAERLAKGSYRWRLVGNAVTVNVVNWIANKLLAPVDYDATEDLPFNNPRYWPAAAWGDGQFRCQSSASTLPATFRRSSLTDYLKFPRKPLSIKAARGFLKRLREGGLRRPDYFEESIQGYINNLEDKEASNV